LSRHMWTTLILTAGVCLQGGNVAVVSLSLSLFLSLSLDLDLDLDLSHSVSLSRALSLSLQGGNVDEVLRDVMGHGNAAAGAILPGLFLFIY